MVCPVQDKTNAEVLVAYCARTLDPAAQEILERHVALCPECTAFVAGQQAVWSALDNWAPEPVSLDFDRRLYARIEKEAKEPLWKRLLFPGVSLSWRPALSVGAACLTLFAAFLLRAPGVPETYNRARVEAVDVEQVERVLEDMDMLQQLSAAPAHPDAEGARTL